MVTLPPYRAVTITAPGARGMGEKLGEGPPDCLFPFLGGLGGQIRLENRSTARAPSARPVRICEPQLADRWRLQRGQAPPTQSPGLLPRVHAGLAASLPAHIPHPPPSQRKHGGQGSPSEVVRGDLGRGTPRRKCKRLRSGWLRPSPGALAAEVELTLTGGSEPFCPD